MHMQYSKPWTTVDSSAQVTTRSSTPCCYNVVRGRLQLISGTRLRACLGGTCNGDNLWRLIWQQFPGTNLEFGVLPHSMASLFAVHVDVDILYLFTERSCVLFRAFSFTAPAKLCAASAVGVVQPIYLLVLTCFLIYRVSICVIYHQWSIWFSRVCIMQNNVGLPFSCILMYKTTVYLLWVFVIVSGALPICDTM